MATENKTQPTTASVKAFIDAQPAQRQADCRALSALMRRVSGKRAVMWGESMVGFGRYYYRYKSGHEGIYFRCGFSPRKNDLTIYVMPQVKQYAAFLKKLGPHKHSVSCLYIKRVSDIDMDVLEALLSEAFLDMARLYPNEKKPIKKG